MDGEKGVAAFQYKTQDTQSHARRMYIHFWHSQKRNLHSNQILCAKRYRIRSEHISILSAIQTHNQCGSCILFLTKNKHIQYRNTMTCRKVFVRIHINAIDYILTSSGNTNLDLVKVKVSIHSIARRYTNCVHERAGVCFETKTSPSSNYHFAVGCPTL